MDVAEMMFMAEAEGVTSIAKTKTAYRNAIKRELKRFESPTIYDFIRVMGRLPAEAQRMFSTAEANKILEEVRTSRRF